MLANLTVCVIDSASRLKDFWGFNKNFYVSFHPQFGRSIPGNQCSDSCKALESHGEYFSAQGFRFGFDPDMLQLLFHHGYKFVFGPGPYRNPVILGGMLKNAPLCLGHLQKYQDLWR